jgi:polyferredoxin
MATLTTPPQPASAKQPKKQFIRRFTSDHSQRIRHTVQWLFMALNVWIGVQFLLWVRYFESGGHGLHVARPAGVEGWLPIAGLMNVKYLLATGKVPPIHPAAMYLFLGFLLISVVVKKAFCSWLCPVGTISEALWKLGRSLFRRNFRLHKWVDIPLRGLKYILLGLFVGLIGYMSASTLLGFMYTPYGLVVDVKMMNFFRGMSFTAAMIVASLVLLSMLVQNFWCRYLCPYGALMGLVSLLSPVKIRRDQEACIDCGKCARACPAHLPVDKLVQIRSVECASCMACVEACPAQNGLQLALPPRREATAAARWRRRVAKPALVTAVVVYIFVGVVLVARATNHWQTVVPDSVYMRLVSHASQLGHPGM